MADRIPLVCGNWKLHKTLGEATSLTHEIVRAVEGTSVEVALAPPFTAIATVASIVAGTPIRVAGQDCFWQERGAFTGEVSPTLLHDAGARMVILGHSERRQLFGETDEGVAKKTRAALAAGLTPIVCVGESLEERESGQTLGRIRTQVEGALGDLPPADLSRIVLAYEPVWAIGTGRTASPAQAQEVHAAIRGQLGTPGQGVRILYGGSVKPDNMPALMTQPDVDGALVGGACLDASSFASIVRYRP